jgi:hypothetical protein
MQEGKKADKETKTSKEITAFFDFLSKRIYGELNLCDITWALCKASEEFKRLFINYCFKEETPEMQVFEREVPFNGCRPDFYCEDMEENTWVIEVKIDSRENLHFEQYKKRYDNIAFIANYDASALCKKELDIKINTWKDFIDDLLKKTENDLIIGYSKYLKKIMGYLEVKEMNLNKVNSLPSFNGVLESIVQEYSKKKLNFHNRHDYLGFDCYGRYINFINKNGKPVKFWAGIYFCDKKENFPYFCIIFTIGDNDWTPKKEVDIIRNLKEGKYLYKPEISDDGNAYFKLKDEFHGILFSNKPELEKQKETIRNSLHEILSYL